MPGIRGASRGCNTCKKRKILCDRAKPECLRCTKAAVMCQGYEKVIMFVNRDASNIKASGRQTLATAYSKASKERNSNRPTRHEVTGEQEVALPKTKPAVGLSRWRSPPGYLWDAVLSATLNDRYKLREPMLELIQSCFAARGNALHSMTVFMKMNEHLNPDEHFYCAINASALARRGQVDSNQELVHQGTSQYVRAIRGFQKVLVEPRTVLRDETLAVCLLLSAFELFTGSESNIFPWISHMDGVAQLVKLRGPQLHVSSFGHELFLHFRVNNSLQSPITRRNCFLAYLEWLTIPFSEVPKDPFHQLRDLTIELISIFEQHDIASLATNEYGEFLTRQKLAGDCYGLKTRMRRWYEATVERSPEQWYMSVSAYDVVSLDLGTEGRVFDSYLEFRDLIAAQVCLTYWGVSILLHATTTANARILSSFPLNIRTITSSIMPDISPDDITLFATHITESIPYCIRSHYRTAGPIITVHPLHAAMQWFRRVEMVREWEWCRLLFRRICSGGNPFMDVGLDDQGLEESAGDGRRNVMHELGAIDFQLRMPRLGSGVLKLDA